MVCALDALPNPIAIPKFPIKGERSKQTVKKKTLYISVQINSNIY